MVRNRITQCREARNLRKSQLAHYARVSRSCITKIERGAATPGLELALRIAKCLKRPVEEIFQLAETGGKPISRPHPAADGNNQQRRKQ